MTATSRRRGAGLPGPVLAVVGPTGAGKTAVADLLCQRTDGEVVSSDSMQVYRGMDIGTAKPDPSERSVPYHCLDLVDPDEPYSVARYQTDSRAAIDDILSRGRTPVVCGGTGLYIRAALDDWTFPPGQAGAPLRDDIESLSLRIGSRALHERLAALDAASAALIHPNNVRRVVRALEMHEAGESYAEQHARFRRRQTVYHIRFVGLAVEREVLHERISARVDAMMAGGLLDEVQGLLERGYRDSLTASQAIGYKELVPVIEQEADLEDAVAAVKRATRRYAKRQMTWFRSDERIPWVDVTGLAVPEATDAMSALLESEGAA